MEMLNNLDLNEILTIVIQAIIIPLITLSGLYLKKFIGTKIEKMQQETKNEVLSKQLEIARQALEACVIATSETFVKDLKKIDNFTDMDKVMAFQETRKAFLNTIGEGTKDALVALYGDYDTWIKVETEKILADTKARDFYL